jgi:hypothetical protein
MVKVSMNFMKSSRWTAAAGVGRGARIVSQYGEGTAEFHVRHRTAEVVDAPHARILAALQEETARSPGGAPRAGYLHVRACYLQGARDLTQLGTDFPK